jgi:hypothetical protein
MPVSYTEAFSNLWLMVRMLFRVSITTGFAPWLITFLVARKFYGRKKVRNRAPVIQFTSWAGVRRQRAIRDLQGADRPSFSTRVRP